MSTLGEVLETYRLSGALRQALVEAPLMPAQGRKGAIDIRAYLVSAFVLGANSPETAHGFLRELIGTQHIDTTSLWQRAIPTQDLDREVSESLILALNDAVQIRLLTGGKDKYLGARHLLFAIVASSYPMVRREAEFAIEDLTGSSLGKWLWPVVEFVFRWMEPQEKAEAWLDLVTSRKAVTEKQLQLLRMNVSEPRHIARNKRAAPRSKPEPTPRPTPQLQAIANAASDDPWALPANHIVGDDETASALARLITARAFKPPLAVGVFGAWGSGKSFLMRRVHQQVDSLSRSGNPTFHAGVAQIRFNAWHYLDADLWASLAGHIFEALDTYARGHGEPDPKAQILGRLSTARDLTLESARGLIQKRRAAVEAEIVRKKAEAALEARRIEFSKSLGEKLLAGTTGAKAFLGFLWKNDAALRKDTLDAVETVYGQKLEVLAGRWSTAEAAAASLKADASLWTGVARQFNWRTACLVAAITALAFLVPLFAPMVLKGLPDWTALFTRVDPVLSAGIAGLSLLASTVSVFTKRAANARDAVVEAVRGYRQAQAGHAQDATAPQVASLATAEAALSDAEAEAERSRQTLDEALRQQADASRAFTAETAAGRLKAFVKARAAQDSLYRSRQGLIGAVRRDFSDLAAMMNPAAETEEQETFVKQRKLYRSQLAQLARLRRGNQTLLTDDEWRTLKAATPEKPDKPPFSRIILYIDDLDRCPPEKVVEVLQAVHLLLAYSLFVVVVAVDVRWLTGAICKVYPELMPDAGEGKAKKSAAALDYLEKIFQVPIWTDAISPAVASNFVALRITPDTPPANTTNAVLGQTLKILTDAGLGAPSPPPLAPEAPAKPDAPKVEPAKSLEPLKLLPDEIDWLTRLAPVAASSPRRLLRLINTYRLARASLGPAQAQTLIDRGYKPFAALLALAAAAPIEFDSLMGDLDLAPSLNEVSTLWAKRGDAELAARTTRLVTLLRAERIEVSPDLRDYIELASRFSFTGGRSAAFPR